MGNSESQYSIQGAKRNSLIIPGKHKPCSLRFRTAKEEDLSPHGWWRGGAGSLNSHSRAMGRGCLSQNKGGHTYVPHHYDYVTTGNKASANGKLSHSSPEMCDHRSGLLLPSENGYHNHGNDQLARERYRGTSGEWDSCDLSGQRTPDRKSLTGRVEERRSPKVVIKKDGTLRVEFTNTTNNRRPPDDSGGPVQLLKFSPTLESTPSPPGTCRTPEPPRSTSSATHTLRTSSPASDCSWYDWPWGDGAEPNEADAELVHPPVRLVVRCACGMGPVGRCSCPTSLPDLYRDPGVAGTFPASRDLRMRYLDARRTPHRASFVSVLDVPTEEECPEAKEYLSYTLPCRKSLPHSESATKKETLKGRMRRISDWTGSLSKKRKLQEPKSKEASECFDSGVDGLTADTSSPSQASSLLWCPGAPQALPTRSESAGALHGNDALRQNIYENFMRELETGRSSGVERQEPSSDTEDTSSDSLGSLEQLDLRFEKEQGVVRKAGWLSFKPLLTLHKDRKLELVPRRKWKQYWVTLKGCTLLFYETYGKSSMEQDAAPRYALLAEDSVVQSVPEHPKKENVFCLSNSYGDVYLFQAASQTDLENWVTAIHSASASIFAKRQGKEDTVRLLRSQTKGLLQKIDMDGKMKKMAELQLSIVSDPKNRRAIESQIQQWEQNLEKFHMDLFRLRCYLASLQGCEQPNPKSLLATASRPSKATLSRLGIFSVSSFHALICSRDEAKLRKHSLSLSLSQHICSKRGLFSSLKGLDNLTKRGHESRPSASQIFEGNDDGQLGHPPPFSSERLNGLANLYSMASSNGTHWDSRLETACVYLPDNQAITVPLKADQTVEDVLSLACKVGGLDLQQHGLRLCRCVGQSLEIRVPAPGELIQDLLYDSLEVLPLNVYTLHMSRPSNTADFGFAVTGYVDGCGNSRIFISEVLPDGLAFGEGLRPGDEILVLNGKDVSSLDLGRLQTLFSEQNLDMTLKRDPITDKLNSTWLNTETKNPCTPVPLRTQPQLQEDFLDQYQKSCPIGALRNPDVPGASVGAGLENGPLPGTRRREMNRNSVETVCTVYHTFQEGPGGLMEGQKGPSGAEPGLPRPCPRHMSATERLRKVIQELVDTEKSYVKDLSCLFEIYLKPLQNETFLTQDEMESLFGSLPEMLNFQRVFLQTLEERIASSPDFSTLESPVHFKKLLFSLGGSFLYYADHFKLYSGFCANHIKVQKVLERAKTDRAFKEFLDAKNPTKQHSSTLESYLIKPVQRVLKYPLLLRELVSLTDTDSEEHYHLTEALKAMEKVASHINEMQKIYEDYGTVFDQLVAEQSDNDKEVTEISMGEFLMHSSVVWLNPFPSLGRMRKDPELTVFVFKRAVILVCRESNKLKKKMCSTRSSYPHSDLDPFKFRWLIPLSALQVRLGNTAGTETNCIWELIHTKSELEGRPETTFQLCSSDPECKGKTIKVIRSLLRENVRRSMRPEPPAERACKERLAPLRSVVPTSARIGSSRASWLGKPPPELPTLMDAPRGGREDSDESSPGSASSGERARKGSPTSAIEAQLQKLSVAEAGPQAPRAEPEGAEPGTDTPEAEPRLVRAPFGPIKRKSNSLRRSQGALLSMREHSRSLDSQTDPAGVDINTLLEREFSVQSLASVVNEDCFYDMTETFGSTTTVPTV